MAYNLGKKVLHICMSGKKILTQTKSPIPRPPKSQMVGLLPPTFKPALQQIKVDEATCVTTDFSLKRGSQLFATCSNLICSNKSLNVGVKRATSLFNSFCSNVAKQVARFCYPVYSTLKVATLKVSASIDIELHTNYLRRKWTMTYTSQL